MPTSLSLAASAVSRVLTKPQVPVRCLRLWRRTKYLALKSLLGRGALNRAPTRPAGRKGTTTKRSFRQDNLLGIAECR
jgi:hypothetical protein